MVNMRKLLTVGLPLRGFDMVAVPNIIPYNSGIIFDYDFSALVYPKTIRIESGSEVLSGTVTESGNEA